MKDCEEKKELLYDLVELYLNTDKNIYIDINDGIGNSGNYDSISFLMLLAITSNADKTKNIYSIYLDIDDEIKNKFINLEYKKIIKSKTETIKKGKIILDDARNYYTRYFGSLDDSKIEEVVENIGNRGHI